MPHDVEYQAGGYRRLNQKTRNAHVATLFGSIELRRYAYRYWHREAADPCIFPLEIELGLIHGATPAMAEAVGRYMAQAGATQQAVLDRLRSQHGVFWGAQLTAPRRNTRDFRGLRGIDAREPRCNGSWNCWKRPGKVQGHAVRCSA